MDQLTTPQKKYLEFAEMQGELRLQFSEESGVPLNVAWL